MITQEDRIRYENCTDDTILGFKLIGGLTNDVLRKYIKGDIAIIATLHTLLGAETNLNWIKARVADELYYRDLIDEKEYDRLSE